MLTYSLQKTPGVPLYEGLYRCIRDDILSGRLRPGEKLPSKRALARHLEISKITVETAYGQLMAEGYLVAREKVGYFVESMERLPPEKPATVSLPPDPSAGGLELSGGGEGFPFSVWSRLQREVMLDYGEKLLRPLPNLGLPELRHAIASHLATFRGMNVDPANILIGAGTDFLYNLLIQLLGRELVYAVEEPGYGKIRKVYAAGGVQAVSAAMDPEGVTVSSLSRAQVLHISPSHHFPTGLITPMSRRKELLHWVTEGEKWIIEDDYDSEFRFHSHPLPSLYSMDAAGRVIYMNTFSKTLAPSIRISYLVLPPSLMAQFQEKLGFYSCTVPSFEQYTLARFLGEGYFEKHINRMRKFYRSRRDRVLDMLSRCACAHRLTVLEEDAGLHFLLKIETGLSDHALKQRLAAAGVRVHALSDYYAEGEPRDFHCLVVDYAGLREETLADLLKLLSQCLEPQDFSSER